MKKMAFLLAWLLVLPFLANPAPGAEKVRFGTPIKGVAYQDLPLLVAEEKGYWKENDLEVQWVSFDAGASLVRALAAGALDMASTLGTDYIMAVVRGVPIIMVADTKVRNDFFVWVRADSHIKEPKDLKGAKVGVPALGSVAHAYGLAATKALGMEKEVKFVGVGGGGPTIAALKAGAIDAVMFTFFVMVPLRFKGEVRPVLSMRDFLPREWLDSSLVSRHDFIEKSAATVKRTVRAWLQSGAFVTENQNWALMKLKTTYGYSEDTARAIYGALTYSRDGKIDPEALENVKNFLIDYGLAAKDKVPPLEKLFSRKFTE